jgi:SAM-dependent methyltransferase
MRRRRRLVQIVYDLASQPWDRLRILDLGSLDGGISLEFARRGAEVVGIEFRRASVLAARAEQERLQIKSATFFQDDVRNLSKQKYGTFDVVVCAGILYHLNAPDVFVFLESIAEVCTGFALIDTHVAASAETEVTYKGQTYSGWNYQEFTQQATTDDVDRALWASSGNRESFWPTPDSLLTALASSGFSSIYECHYPAVIDGSSDRVAVVATKRPRQNLIAQPLPEDWLNEPFPQDPLPLSPAQQGYRDEKKRSGR